MVRHVRRSARWLALALVVALAAMTAPIQARSPARAQAGPGCDPSRPAVAHHAGGRLLRPQPAGRPIPCGMTIGFNGAESRIAVTDTGAVIYAAAVITPGVLGTGFLGEAAGPRPQSVLSPGGLAVSHDNGRRWSFVAPRGMTWLAQDDGLHVDRSTGRIFWSNFTPNPIPQGGIGPLQQLPFQNANLLVGTGDGRAWHHTQAVCCPFFSENPRFATAPAPAGQPKPVGYPNVVYFCANTTVGFTGPIIAGRVCSRSLNGGITWEYASLLFTSGIPQHPECGMAGEEVRAIDGNYPQAAPDGSLYVKVECGGRTFLARSRDRASTWPIERAPDGSPLEIPHADELRVDSAGNLYLARAENGRLFLRVSRDRGRTWGPDLDVTAPGITAGGGGISGDATWFVAVRRPGHVAFAYYGHRGESEAADGWITASRNALARRPTFFSASVNRPGEPMLIDARGTRPPGPGYLDYNGTDIGPDGSPWGSFVQDCPPDARDAACADGDGPKLFAVRGFVGRLRWR